MSSGPLLDGDAVATPRTRRTPDHRLSADQATPYRDELLDLKSG
ncbi:hypothetical protein [Kribbella sp. CA-293567]|nr:hypothetical protein [Kribbella sp. CA-293567]WBQ07114.1 hypothetical protein OX958_10010 [Kribbella sp. CA-293567]